MELKGVEYLRAQLRKKQPRVKRRYEYYDMKKQVEYFSKLLPSEYRWMSHALGWSTKAVDSIADRLNFNEFRDDNFFMQEIYELNNSDILFDSAILSALIGSCSFIYIAEQEGYPSLQVIDGYNATGIVDDTTGLLKEGYAVLERDKNGNVTLEAYLEPGKTTIYENKTPTDVIENTALYPLLVPIIHRPEATRPFGRSRITRACMSYQQGALRTLKRSEICSEFYSFPQKYVLGLDDEAEFNKTAATYSSFLRFGNDENGEKPTVGSFTQQSMSPFLDELKMFASLFAGESGLTMDDLGFASSNPSSSEAIRASHESLRLSTRKAQKCFAVGFINAGYLAACVRDKKDYARKEIYRTKIAWEPIFGVDASALGAIGDSVQKIETSFPGYMTEEKVHDIFGI